MRAVDIVLYETKYKNVFFPFVISRKNGGEKFRLLTSDDLSRDLVKGNPPDLFKEQSAFPETGSEAARSEITIPGARL